MKRIITSLRRHGRRVGTILGLSALLTVGLAAPAVAAEHVFQAQVAVASVTADAPPAGPGQPTLIDIVVSTIQGSTSLTWVDVLQLLVIPLLPALVGLVNRAANWPGLVKTIALGVLAVLSQVLPDAVQAANDGTVFDWLRALLSAGVAWYLAQKTYDKIYKAPLNRGYSPNSTIPPTTIATKIAGD